MSRKPKIVQEDKFRKDILKMAKRLGCDIEVQQIFSKYDNLLKNCTNQEERKQIGELGCTELHRFLDCKGGLIINQKLVIPADPNYKESE